MDRDDEGRRAVDVRFLTVLDLDEVTNGHRNRPPDTGWTMRFDRERDDGSIHMYLVRADETGDLRLVAQDDSSTEARLQVRPAVRPGQSHEPGADR